MTKENINIICQQCTRKCKQPDRLELISCPLFHPVEDAAKDPRIEKEGHREVK